MSKRLTSDQLWELSVAILAWALEHNKVEWLNDFQDRARIA